MESRNKLTMCRLCLCENECFINIFEMNDWQGYVAAVVISDLLQFQVHETDNYPHVVCTMCLTKLTDFKQFKESCQNSRVTYDKMFGSSETLVEHQTDTVELITVKAEPVDYSDNEGDVSKEFVVPVGAEEDKPHEMDPIEASNDDVVSDEIKEEPMEDIGGDGSGSGLSEEDPLRETSSDEEEEEDGGQTSQKGAGGSKGSYECHLCKKVLTTKNGLRSHLAGHGLGKSYKCEVCGKICASKSNLAKHTVVHTNEKPFECKECSKRFAQYNNLKLHMRIHEGSKPYVCEECNMSFRQSCNLKRHMRVHSDLKPYECELCSATFRHKTSLTYHARTHSKVVVPLKCGMCSKEFTRSDYLKRHILMHTGDKPHSCTHCGNQFRYKENLVRHLKTLCEKKC